MLNNGSTNNNCGSPNIVSIENVPAPPNATQILTSSQGTGTTTFAFRVWHTTSMAWMTLDTTMADNWSPGGSATRVTRDILPAFTVTEKHYWEQSGVITPIQVVGQTANPQVAVPCSYGGSAYYTPFGRGNVIGGTGTGFRPDLSFPNEFAAQAWALGDANDWSLAKLFSVSYLSSPYTTLLDEATGRIPAVNNGPPGPGGYGIGTSYPQLGTPQPQFDTPNVVDYAVELEGAPNAATNWASGIWVNQFYNGSDHQPNWQGFTYAVYGSRHWLDLLYYHGNRLYSGQFAGPGVGTRSDNLGGTTPTYYGLYLSCCQGRGSARAIWDRTIAAALGGDSNIERAYFNDVITENGNYYPRWLVWKNGAGNSNWTTSIIAPDNLGGGFEVDTFITNYLFNAAYEMDVLLHAPLGVGWMPNFQTFYEGLCGELMAGRPVSFQCIGYSYSPAAHDDQNISQGNVGQFINGTDASDFGAFDNATDVLAGGVLRQHPFVFPFAPGGTIKWANQVGECCSGFDIDQLPGNTWFAVTNANDSAGTFKVICPIGHAVDATCPTPGAAFTNFTRNGVPVVENNDYVFYRPNYDPGAGGGFSDFNYTGYAEQTLNGLQILGFDLSHAQSVFAFRMGANAPGYVGPSQWWDTSIVVPGIPAVVTYGNQFPTLACAAASGTVVSSLALIQGNGNASSGWTVLPTSSDTTHFVISGNNLVTAGSLPCNTTQAIQVQGTQPGSDGGNVVGQINLVIGSLGVNSAVGAASHQ